MSAKKATEAPKKTAPAKVSEPAKTAVEEPVKETAVKAEEAPAKKVETPKKTAPKTTTKTNTRTAKTEKTAVSQNVYIQFAGKEVRTEEIVEQVKAAWTAEGHRASSIKSLEVYVKPEDMAAYYVVNGKTTGKVEL